MQSVKQFHAHLYQLYEKGISQAMVSLQGLHMSDAFRYYNALTNMGLQSFYPRCLKLGGTPKQLLSILGRCITGWWLCVTYTSLLLAWMHWTSWTTILGVMPSATRECTELEGQGNVKKSHKKKSKSQGQRRHLAQRSPKDHNSRMPLNTFYLVQPENVSQFTSWIYLDPPGFISLVSPCSIRQTVASFFSHNVYDVMVHTLIILSCVSSLTC